MAIEFSPVVGMDFFKLTRLQGEWESRYPDISDRPGAPPTELNEPQNGFRFNFGEPPRRIWAASLTDGQLVQSQADRLILNWRKDFSAVSYPGYLSHLRAEYHKLWTELSAFVDRSGLGEPIPILAEFTYVNIVPLEPGDTLSDVVTVVRSPKDELPGTDKFARFQFVRDIDRSDEHPYAAQLSITGEPRELAPDQKQLVFTVVARTILGDLADDPLAGLDAAHALASHTFSRIVTEEKQQEWGRTQ